MSVVGEPAVSARGVTRVFHTRRFRRVALDDVSFTLGLGRSLAVVGESGSGKTTLGRIIAGLDRPTTGELLVEGVVPRPRGGAPSPVQVVFQNPGEALNKYMSVGASVAEPLRALPRMARRGRVVELFEQVGLDPTTAHRRPDTFSGGQQQRAVIARALAASPRVLVCDEPTSALDVSVQAQVLNLLLRLQESLGFALVLVTHDLGVVRVVAETVILLREGRIQEHSPADHFFARPDSAYGRTLLAAAT